MSQIQTYRILRLNSVILYNVPVTHQTAENHMLLAVLL